MENLNSVCYIDQITEIRNIEGADNIELVVIGGWTCVAQKNQYKESDLVVIATTDAVIPVELSEKMNVTQYLRKGQRVRTVKLRGVYSECLIIPISYATTISIKTGTDAMKALSIFKYEPPLKNIQLAGGKVFKYKQNPNFHVYYKFPNLKNVSGLFTELDSVEITRKIHGTNARYGIVKKHKLSFFDKLKKFLKLANKWDDYEYVYGSHNVEKGSDSQGFYLTDVWGSVATSYNIKSKLWTFCKTYNPIDIGEGIIVYGEIYGAGIQSNYDYGLTDVRFAGFDIKINGNYMPPSECSYHVTEDLKLPYVEVLHTGRWSAEIQDKLTLKNYIDESKVPHEGIVIKHVSGAREKVAKVINPDYLIFGEKNNVGDSH
jgi:RNA ligase (TIGR02306 family)